VKSQLEVVYSNEIPEGIRLEANGKIIIGTKIIELVDIQAI
jgi:hypothetical protein